MPHQRHRNQHREQALQHQRAENQVGRLQHGQQVQAHQAHRQEQAQRDRAHQVGGVQVHAMFEQVRQVGKGHRAEQAGQEGREALMPRPASQPCQASAMPMVRPSISNWRNQRSDEVHRPKRRVVGGWVCSVTSPCTGVVGRAAAGRACTALQQLGRDHAAEHAAGHQTERGAGHADVEAILCVGRQLLPGPGGGRAVAAQKGRAAQEHGQRRRLAKGPGHAGADRVLRHGQQARWPATSAPPQRRRRAARAGARVRPSVVKNTSSSALRAWVPKLNCQPSVLHHQQQPRATRKPPTTAGGME